MDAKGGRIMRDVSRENLRKRMAIILFEKGKGEALTAPVIQAELGTRFQISGSMTTVEANDLALLLRRQARHAARTDLATIGDEGTEGVDVLVVDRLDTRDLQRVLLGSTALLGTDLLGRGATCFSHGYLLTSST